MTATGYVRQSAAQILSGNTIQASDFNNEYNKLQDFASGSIGHDHTGGSGLGPQIVLTTAVSGILPTANGGTGIANGTNNTLTFTGNYTLGLNLTGNTVVTLPTSGTLLSSATVGTITSGTWNGTIIAETYGGTGVSALSSITSLSGLTTVGTIGTGTWAGSVVTGQYGGTGTANTGKTITLGGNFATSGSFGCTLTLSALTNVTLPTGGTLVNSAVSTLSSLTSIGTIGTGTWQGTTIGSTYGGTGINNGSSTITLGGSLTFSGAFTTAITVTGNTTVTLPTTGTLVNTAVTALSSLVTVSTITTGTWQATKVAQAYGGTNQDSSASTGIAQVSSGTWSFATSLPNGTTATTQTAADNSTKVATTAYVDTAGTVLQQVRTQTGAVASGSTAIPVDDTIPQSTEGDQYMTLAITPKSATSKLVIQVVFNGAVSTGGSIILALFQDSTANALAVGTSVQEPVNSAPMQAVLTHTMTSGTTSATTFKVRAAPGAGTLTFNGASGSRLFGGVYISSILITEYAA